MEMSMFSSRIRTEGLDISISIMMFRSMFIEDGCRQLLSGIIFGCIFGTITNIVNLPEISVQSLKMESIIDR